MRAALTPLLAIAAALPTAGCFSHPRDIDMRQARAETCTAGDCMREELRNCASMENRSAGRCDPRTAPPATAVSNDDLRRQEKALRKAAR